MIRTLEWTNESLRILDQTLLPLEERYLDLTTLDQVIEAIRSLRVRGAPAIGVSAAYGMVIAARSIASSDVTIFLKELRELANRLIAARPTAVNLEWAVESIMIRLEERPPEKTEAIVSGILKQAMAIHEDDRQRCDVMADHGVQIIPDKAGILTHCNTGYLATAGIGTALGVIFRAHEAGKVSMVYADETRPLLQGARLTAWECAKVSVPHTLICDSMAAVLMRQGKVDLVIVGADRIAADGSAANKIGTYGVAVQAHHHNVPFYISAPLSTFDLNLVSGEAIPIEERNQDEVRRIMNTCQIGPEETPCWNPAFDVTPPHLISGIITEAGILKPPYAHSIAEAFDV
ncbi:MAG: S-methyl-5-thioribose-1-phosphate isomerase [Verrucomicrobiota bacterium]